MPEQYLKQTFDLDTLKEGSLVGFTLLGETRRGFITLATPDMIEVVYYSPEQDNLVSFFTFDLAEAALLDAFEVL